MSDRIKLVTSARAVPVFNSDDLLTIAKERATDASVFAERDAFFWRSRISNSNLDFYFTRMSDVTLQNFAAGADAGVSFQDSHEYRKLGFGRSLRGIYIPAAEGEVTDDGYPAHQTHADFFTIRGISLNGANTTDFIDAVRAGVVVDVSVGFWATKIRCSICGGDMFQGWFGIYGYDCDHVPGLTYGVTDAEGNPLIDMNGNPVKRVAFAWIDDGELSEVSQVYDGATPDAGNLKAQLMAEAGKLSDSDRMTLERRYRTKLPVPPRVYALSQGGDDMTQRKPGTKATALRDAAETEADELETTIVDDADETVEEIADETVIVDDDDESDVENETETEAERSVMPDEELAELRAYYATHNIKLGANPYQAIRTLCDKVIELRSLAADGRRYRKDLEQEAESALVRAMGGSVKLETYRSVFKRSSIDELKTLIADYTAQGDQRFPGGRHTTDEEGDSKLITLSPQKPSKAHHA